MTKQEFLAISLGKGLILQSPYGFRPNCKESTGISRLVYLTGDLYADIENKTFPEEFIPICHPLSDYVLFDEIGIIYEVAIQNLIKGNLSIEQTDFWLVSWLIKHHFDIAGLIEKGEAIDINTLNENPYE